MVHVIGEILVDIFRDGDDEEVFPGGAPFNVACNIKHFDGNCSFYGSIGKDDYGKLLKKVVKKQNFEFLVLKTHSNLETTQAVVTLKNGERSFKFKRENGADYVLNVSHLNKLWILKNNIVHIGSLMLSFPKGKRFFYRAVEYAKNKGALISFDVNYRDDIFSSEAEAKRIFKKAIQVADFIKISEEELTVLSSKVRFEAAVRELVRDDQIAFISRGEKGSAAYVNGKFIYADTIKVEPIDTTGAGDAFYSYILYELDKNRSILKKEEKIVEMLARANAVGAIATLKKGATGVVPTINELDRYLEENM